MPAIKHPEKLKSTVYFRDGELPSIVRKMRQAPSNTFVAVGHDRLSSSVAASSQSAV